MFRKFGSVDWTVGKLLALVLAVVVIVLVIWGVSTGGLNPLIEKTSGKFNEVLILLNKLRGVESPYDTECIFLKADIDGVGTGDAWLCKNECNFSLDKELIISANNYKDLILKEDKLYYTRNNRRIEVSSGLIVNWREIDKQREAYKILENDFNEYIIKGQEDLSFFQDNIIDFRIGDNDYLRWINGKWFKGETSFKIPVQDIEIGITREKDVPRETILWSLQKDWKNSNAWKKMQEINKPIYYRINENGVVYKIFEDSTRATYIEEEKIKESQNSYVQLIFTGESRQAKISSDNDILKLIGWYDSQEVVKNFKQRQGKIDELKNDLEELKKSENEYSGASVNIFEPQNSVVFYLDSPDGTYGIKINKENDLALVKIKDQSISYIANPKYFKMDNEKWNNIKKLNLIYKYLDDRC